MWLDNSELVEVASVDMSEDYDWAVLEILYDRETRTYYAYEDSGCSCNGPWETVYSLDDLDKLENRFDALKRLTDYIKTYRGSEYGTWDSVKALGAVEKVANFKEESA